MTRRCTYLFFIWAMLLYPALLKSQLPVTRFDRFRFIKQTMRTVGETSAGSLKLYQHGGRLYEFIPFTGDSARCGNRPVTAFAGPNLFVLVCDTNAVSLHELVFKGLTTLDPLILADGSFIASTNGQSDFFSPGNQLFRKLPVRSNYNGSLHHLIRCGLDGNVRSLDTFYVESTMQTGAYDSLEKSFWVLFGNVRDFDSTLATHREWFRKGRSTLVKLSENGQLLTVAQLDRGYTRLHGYPGSLCVFGEQETGEATREIHLSGVDPATGKLTWTHNLAGETGLIDVQLNHSGSCLALVYKNKLRVDGEMVKVDTDYTESKLILFAFDPYGKRRWTRTAILGNTGVYQMTLFDQHLDFLLYKNPAVNSTFKWNRRYLNSDDIEPGSNRLLIDNSGNVIYIYPLRAAFPSEVVFAARNNIHYVNLYNRDTLTVMGRRYIFSGDPLTREEFLFARIEADTSSLPYRFSKMQPAITLYPNPTSSTFNYSGSYNSWQSGTTHIYDLQGNLLQSFQQRLSSPIDVSNLAKGIYFVTLDLARYGKYSFRLMKN